MAPFVPGQVLTAAQLNSALDAKFDAGGVSSFSATVLAKPTAQQWKAAIGLVGGPLSTVVNNVVLWDSTDGTTLKDSGVAWGNVAQLTPSGPQTWGGGQDFSGATTVTVPDIAVTDYSAAAVSTKHLQDFYSYLLTNSIIAPINNPAFTGNPTAPTQAAGNNSTRLATTAFVQTAINNRVPASNTQYGVMFGNGTGALSVTAALTAGQIVIGVTGAAPRALSMSGDATLASSGALTVTKINGNPTGTAANNIVQLDGSARLPAVDGSLLTGITSTWAPGTLVGLTLSRASATTVGIATGFARNEDGGTAFNMTLASAITKSLSAWAAGTGNGGLDTGSIAASTWYHVWLIRKDSDGSIDALLSLSATAPTMPSGYTARRRLGAIKTDGSSQVTAFTQVGDDFIWTVPVMDRNGNSASGATSLTISVPSGIRVKARLRGAVETTTSNFVTMSVYSPEITDQSAMAGNANSASLVIPVSGLPPTNGTWGSGVFDVMTNTSAQVRVAVTSSSTAGIVALQTDGWIDTRGRL